MTNLSALTAAALADILNGLRPDAKPLKPTSYSKAKLIEMIEALRPAPKPARKPKADPVTYERPDPAADSDEDPLTLMEVAISLGLSPKTARARYRTRVFNDGQYSRYLFARTAKNRKILVDAIS